MTYDAVILDKHDGVAVLTLNRPTTLNAWNARMCEETEAILKDLDRDAATKVLVVTGAGKGFSSGADVVDELGKLAAGAATLQETMLGGPIRGKPNPVTISLMLRQMEKPVIGAINGVAVGAGASIALACDVRIASENAKFGMAFILRGVLPDSGCTFYLPKLVGTAKACELVFGADIIEAVEAERLGMVNRVVPHDQLMEATMELARKIASRPPIALKYSKKAIYKGHGETDLASHLLYEYALAVLCIGTEDHKESLKAFAEKREPVFKGR